MIKTPSTTMIGGAGIWTPGCTVLGSMQKTLDQLIKSLFANNEQGFAYDPNDLSTMFQDAAGATPVTSLGQPVGLILDKSGRDNHAYQTTSAARPLFKQVPILGNELVVNGDFNSGTDGWVAAFESTISNVSGKLRLVAVKSNPYGQQIISNLTVGRKYVVRLGKAVKNSSGTWIAYLGNTNGLYKMEYIPTPIALETGDKEVLITATSSTLNIQLVGGAVTAGDYADFDNVSVKELLGYRTDRNYIKYDGVDDKLLTSFSAPLTNCTVVRAVPNEGTKILTNQTIPTPYNDNTDHCGLIVINRALTATETSLITKLFNKAAGV